MRFAERERCAVQADSAALRAQRVKHGEVVRGVWLKRTLVVRTLPNGGWSEDRLGALDVTRHRFHGRGIMLDPFG